MLRRCPHHSIPTWLLVQTFYNGLVLLTGTLVNAAANGTLMGKTPDEAYDLLEEMATNAFQWPIDRSTPRKALGVHEVDAFTLLLA